MSDSSPLWCATDEPRSPHSERNEFGGTNYCTGRTGAFTVGRPGAGETCARCGRVGQMFGQASRGDSRAWYCHDDYESSCYRAAMFDGFPELE